MRWPAWRCLHYSTCRKKIRNAPRELSCKKAWRRGGACLWETHLFFFFLACLCECLTESPWFVVAAKVHLKWQIHEIVCLIWIFFLCCVYTRFGSMVLVLATLRFSPKSRHVWIIWEAASPAPAPFQILPRCSACDAAISNTAPGASLAVLSRPAQHTSSASALFQSPCDMRPHRCKPLNIVPLTLEAPWGNIIISTDVYLQKAKPCIGNKPNALTSFVISKLLA